MSNPLDDFWAGRPPGAERIFSPEAIAVIKARAPFVSGGGYTSFGRARPAMTAQYRIIMYERTTDRVGGIINVPTQLANQVLSLAGIASATEPGESELNDNQALAIGTLLNFRVNAGRYIHHLEIDVLDDGSAPVEKDGG